MGLGLVIAGRLVALGLVGAVSYFAARRAVRSEIDAQVEALKARIEAGYLDGYIRRLFKDE